MKIFKRITLLFLVVLIAFVWYNYKKLHIVSGYAAKNMASNVFMAHRNASEINAIDNNVASINMASTTVNTSEKSATASVFGFMQRTAVYREGLGAVLINDSYDATASYLIPKRDFTPKNKPFPYGNLPQKDTVFSNVDYTALKKAVSSAFDTEGVTKLQTRSLLVIYKDQIIAEKYAKGFTKDTKLIGWSMTKSIVATLYGILEKQGEINVQNTVNIAAWKADKRANITYHNLLQMNSGLAWEEDYTQISDVTKMLFLDSNMSKNQHTKKTISKPNEHWNYSSGTTNLLSGLLREQFKTQQTYLDFPYTQLIDKIGMYSMLIETDLAGNFVGSSYGWANTRDWAKFGLLYLHNGTWNGEQLFNKSWANYVATPTNTSVGSYGAQFWLNAEGVLPDIPKDTYYADGYQGQRVFIIPSKEMVIVRMGLDNIDFNKMVKEILNTVK